MSGFSASERGVLCPHRLDQGSDTDDVHDPRQIVGEHTQRHLGADIFEPLHQEVGRTHPHLDRAEGMFDRLTALTHLYLSPNKFESLPPLFGNFPDMRVLTIKDNELTELPERFGKMTSLRSLDFRNNQLTKLPFTFGDLTALTELDLSQNHLTSICEEIGCV